MIPPWVDCDVDEDGKQVCPDDFYLGNLAGRGYKDWPFPEPTGGRYVYRQMDTGDIFILESPKVGVLENPLLVKRNSKAWKAISSAIYAKKAGKRQAVADVFSKLASAATAVAAAGAKPAKRARAPEVVAPVEDVDVPAESSDFPWIPVAVAGASAVALYAIFGGGK